MFMACNYDKGNIPEQLLSLLYHGMLFCLRNSFVKRFHKQVGEIYDSMY